MQNITSESDYLLIGEANIVNVNNLTLNNCKGASYNMLLRNVSNVSVQNCKDISTEATNNVFVRAYTKDDGITKNILIKNISTDKEEIDINNASNVINDNVYETLWEGSKTTGNIDLKDSLDKFYDYRIIVNMYGAIDRELMFADNGKFLLRDLNLRDDGLLPNLGFTECSISKINNTKLNIDRLIQVNISSNGSLSNVETSSYIKKIYAKRKKY